MITIVIDNETAYLIIIHKSYNNDNNNSNNNNKNINNNNNKDKDLTWVMLLALALERRPLVKLTRLPVLLLKCWIS